MLLCRRSLGLRSVRQEEFPVLTTDPVTGLAMETAKIFKSTDLPIRRLGVAQDPHTFTRVWAEVPPLFAEIELDVREGVAPMLVGRLVDDAIPGGYYVDHGRRVRWHLGHVLPTRAAEALRSKVAGLRGRAEGSMEAQVRVAVEAFAENYAAVRDRILQLTTEDGGEVG